MSEPQSYEQRLSLPADAVWRILTCAAGAQRWLGVVQDHGLEVGALVPVRGAGSAQVAAFDTVKFRLKLVFPTDHHADLELVPDGARCRMVVRDHGADGALAQGWAGLLNAAEFVVDETRANRKPRQAVVVVHGIGNQRPQRTLRSFVSALVPPQQRWNKPDRVSDSYELRRYQLRRNTGRPRTDIFELYWASKVPGTKKQHVLAWLKTILLRRPGNLSDRLRPVAYLTYAVGAAAIIGVLALLAAAGRDGVMSVWQAGSALASVGWVSLVLSVLGAAANGFVIDTLGDAARYLDDAPINISVRQEIRHTGVELLRRLHSDGDYDRITLVGHSLGSVICYDLVRLYWCEVHLGHDAPPAPAQTALEDYLRTPHANDVDAYRHRQRALWREYRRLGSPWLISDLVTIGSPLTHAGTLLAASSEGLNARITDNEFPTCPPHDPAHAFDRRVKYLAEGNIRTLRMPTPGAPFGLTRWTNLYAPARAIVCGDPIGGPLADVFGAGVKDVEVSLSSWWRRNTPLAHTSYWHEPLAEGGATRELWKALDIDSVSWLSGHVDDMPWESSIGARDGTAEQ